MVKKVLVLMSLAFIATGCNITINETSEVAEVEVATEPMSLEDPLSIILDNHTFFIEQVKSTVIEIDRETTSKLNVTITEDGYTDDSIKGMTYTMVMEKQADDTWKVTSNEESGMECYRGITDDGLCL